jgi:hypothetical protein
MPARLTVVPQEIVGERHLGVGREQGGRAAGGRHAIDAGLHVCRERGQAGVQVALRIEGEAGEEAWPGPRRGKVAKGSVTPSTVRTTSCSVAMPT